MRELAVVRPGGDVEIHVAGQFAVLVADHIGVAVVDDALDQVDHVDDMPGRARLVRGCEHAELVVRVRELALVMVCACPPILARCGGLVENLVVDVGHIANERDLVAEPLKPAANDVERDGRANMADMRGALHGRATHVHAHFAGFDRLETRDRMRRRVVELQIDGRIGNAVIAGGERFVKLVCSV